MIETYVRGKEAIRQVDSNLSPPSQNYPTWSSLPPIVVSFLHSINLFFLTDNFSPPTSQEQERGSSSRGFERPRTPPRFSQVNTS